MPRVLITCPETERPVYTHLNHNWTTFEAAHIGEQAVDCPHCGRKHVWRREDAYLDEAGGSN